MAPLPEPIAHSSTLIERTGIPRRVLSRLLTATKIGVGFRVLDVGCGGGELAAYLASLGVFCVGMDESAVNVIEARRGVPGCEFICTSTSGPATGPRGDFDLVLVREAAVFQKSLLSPAALSASLEFLARPPGRLPGFSGRIGGGTRTEGGHRPSCYARHVGSLPASFELLELPHGLLLGRPFRLRGTEQNRPGYAIAVVRLSPRPLSQDEWKQAAEFASHASAAPCCEWAARTVDTAGHRSKAA